MITNSVIIRMYLLPLIPFQNSCIARCQQSPKSEYEQRRKEMDKLNKRLQEESELITVKIALTEFNIQTLAARTRQHTARLYLPDLAKQHFAHWVLPFI